MSQVADRETPVLPERTIEDLAQALDQASSRLADLDPLPRQVATDLKTALDDLHREALVRIVRTLREDPRGKELLFELADDPSVRIVMLMHALIRQDPMTLAQQALDTVRPQLQSHGGDVELVRIDDGLAYVRLSGACNGCSMSAVTMRNGVEEALKQHVPGITGVEVLPNEPGPALIPLGEVGIRLPEPQRGWCRTLELDKFDLDEIVAVTLEPEDAAAVEAIVVNIGGQLAAYENVCAHLGMPLDTAEIDPVAGTLTCSWHGFCFDALSGECRSMPGTQLAQLPLRVDNGYVWVRVEA